MSKLAAVWHERWFWLAGSWLLAVLWANLSWGLSRPRTGAAGRFATRLISSAARLSSWRFSRWLLQFFRLLYYIGLPLAALLLGHDALVERHLGLWGSAAMSATSAERWADWTRSLGWAVALGVGSWTLLALGWWTYRRALGAAREDTVLFQHRPSGWACLREALYHEVHWAFYRNAFVVVGEAQAWGTYWGAWAGLALAGLEATLNPGWRTGLDDPRRAPVQLMRGALAVVSSVLFLLTQNLWLAIAVHWGVSWGLSALVQGRSANVMRET